MEEKINIAEILKDKPQGTKLYSRICGAVELKKVIDVRKKKSIVVKELNSGNQHRFWHDGNFFRAGQCVLQPSENMADWSKFSWKKGDLLINSCGLQCIFKEWASDDYTKFNGCYSNSRDGYEDVSNAETAKFVKLDNNIAYEYVREIENRCGGKLNLESLEIEKTQPEFKDGDIVFMKGIKSKLFANCIFILRSEYKDGDERAFYYAFYNADDKYTLDEYGNTKVHYSLRLATDSEKQQLFDALSKKGKRWDAEKKEIVDLKPKVELKPFDKVLCRNSKDDTWEADFFARLTRKEIDYTQSGKYLCVGDLWMYCIPYNEETAHLLGTADDWEGGEQ